MDGLIFQIVIFLILFSVGWGFGRHIEQKHLRELDEKERQLAHIRIDTNRFVETSAKGQLVSSNVVISHDYFKYVLATIKNFFGGRLAVFVTSCQKDFILSIITLRTKSRVDRVEFLVREVTVGC